MKVETYACDVCGKQKGSVNHWWLVYRIDTDLEDGTLLKGIGIRQWLEEFARIDGFSHVCGAECVQKKVNEFQQKAQE